MHDTPSIIGSWLTLFVAALSDYDVDSDAFLRSRGVDYNRQSDPEQRIPLGLMRKLWDDAAELTGDPHIGLKAGSFVTPTTFSALGIALWSSCSIKDMLQCWCRYMHVFSTAGESHLQEEKDLLRLHGRTHYSRDAQASEFAIDATFSALAHLCRNHYQGNYKPLGITLPRPTPGDPDTYQRWFDCPVSFRENTFELLLNRAEAEAPIPGGNRQLALATEQLVADYLARMSTPDIRQRLQKVLFELLPRAEATLEKAAHELHLSPRTLHRKLEEVDSSYRQELETARHELALQYIARPRLSIGDIGFLLGFSSTSNFSRAFKRWTGNTPQAYRQLNSSPQTDGNAH